jgi:hypothetical protein
MSELHVRGMDARSSLVNIMEEFLHVLSRNILVLKTDRQVGSVV